MTNLMGIGNNPCRIMILAWYFYFSRYVFKSLKLYDTIPYGSERDGWVLVNLATVIVCHVIDLTINQFSIIILVRRIEVNLQVNEISTHIKLRDKDSWWTLVFQVWSALLLCEFPCHLWVCRYVENGKCVLHEDRTQTEFFCRSRVFSSEGVCVIILVLPCL